MKTETILIKKLEHIQSLLAECPTSLGEITDIAVITQTLGAIHTILNSAHHLQDLTRESHLQIAAKLPPRNAK